MLCVTERLESSVKASSRMRSPGRRSPRAPANVVDDALAVFDHPSHSTLVALDARVPGGLVVPLGDAQVAARPPLLSVPYGCYPV